MNPNQGTFLTLLIGMLVLASGCHKTPSAQKLNYSADGVEQVESAIASYDWSDF